MRTATETWEDDNGGMVEMRNNGDCINNQWRRQRRKRTVAEMIDNRDGYGNGGDAGRQQKRYGTTDMGKGVGRKATD